MTTSYKFYFSNKDGYNFACETLRNVFASTVTVNLSMCNWEDAWRIMLSGPDGDVMRAGQTCTRFGGVQE
jgi:hypothetical protein